jgi:hypothetical protein
LPICSIVKAFDLYVKAVALGTTKTSRIRDKSVVMLVVRASAMYAFPSSPV